MTAPYDGKVLVVDGGDEVSSHVVKWIEGAKIGGTMPLGTLLESLLVEFGHINCHILPMDEFLPLYEANQFYLANLFFFVGNKILTHEERSMTTQTL